MAGNCTPSRFSRRRVLRTTARGLATSAVAGLLAACGADAPPATSAPPTPTATSPRASAAPSAAPATSAAPAASAASPAAAASARPSATASASAAPATSAAPAARPTGVLQIGRQAEFNAVWSPVKSSNGTHSQVFDLVFSKLARFDAELNIVPELAERFEISPDARVYTFFLRKDVKWHDGTPFTARDVIFTYKLAMTKAVGARQYAKLSLVIGAKDFYEGKTDKVPGLEMPDDYTVRFTLEAPNVSFLIGTSHSNALMWILPEHKLKDLDPAQVEKHPFTLNPTVGTGPFAWVQYVPDQYVEFKANTAYFKGTPKIEKVFLRLAEPTAALAQLERGELDLMPNLTTRDAERLKADARLTIFPAPGVGVFQTAINNERFKDKRIRQAFYYAVNREAMLRVVLQGQGRLVHSTVIGPSWATYDDLNQYKHDPARAKQLLQEAGWDASRKVELIWSKGFQAIELAAPIFQQQLKEVGVEVVLAPLESSAFVKKITMDVDYDLGWFSGGVYGMDPDVSSLYYESANHTPRGANTTHYANAELDALFQQGRGITDTARRKEIYGKVAKILNEDVPTLFWWSENINWGISKRIQGIKPGPNTDIQWNIHEWSLTS